MNKNESVDLVEIKGVLRSLGIGRVYVVDEDLNQYLLLGLYSDKQYLILIARGNHAWYSKILPADVVLEPYWRCSYVAYVPEGLYVFAKTVSELGNKIVKVLERYRRHRS